ncbi:uncharacterized protein LOC129728034 [Wyeomyia smithii]|uniref:uncharacterized protein LOC129728034 n=1 Tax=Wyeomyia smithii TaxID=174621 RepID=UPI002467C5C9|nr:uncharacterized protein LOC129728034 [Wyeomyia smithii]
MAEIDGSGSHFNVKTELDDSAMIKIEVTEIFDPDDLGSDSNSIDQCGSLTEKSQQKILSEDISYSYSKHHRKGIYKRTMSQIASGYVLKKDNFFHCGIDAGGCNYVQRQLDISNFVRHFRTVHPQSAHKIGLFRDGMEPKRKRIISRKAIAIDVQRALEACIKLVTCHNLPLRCFEWSGLRLLLDPISEALGLQMRHKDIKLHIHSAAKQVTNLIKAGIENKFVSIRIDSISRHGRHVLAVNAQYEKNREVVMYSLGIIEVRKKSTAKQLKCKLDNVFHRNGLTKEQIFIIVVDNAASIICSEKQLQKSFTDTIVSNELVNVNDFNDSQKEEDLLEALSQELAEQYFVVRGAARMLYIALNDVLQDSDTRVVQITEFANCLRKVKYKHDFSVSKASYPPLCPPLIWSGKYSTFKSIVEQEDFFTSLGQLFPELKLSCELWQFMKEYIAAFTPVYNIIMMMQNEHHPFPDFYMQWLVAIKKVRSLSDNYISKPLVEALTKRLGDLKENIVFKVALYLDPRFNYLNSAVFTNAEKIEIQNYIIDLMNKIGNIKPTESPARLAESEPSNASKDDMDDFLTEMFGGTLETSQNALRYKNSPLLQLVKVLEIEPRQPHNYDVWKHWIMNQTSSAELFSVAMVVLAAPSNYIPIDKVLSTLGVLITGIDNENDGQALEDILLVKLNQCFLERIDLSKDNSDNQESSDAGN